MHETNSIFPKRKPLHAPRVPNKNRPKHPAPFRAGHNFLLLVVWGAGYDVEEGNKDCSARAARLKRSAKVHGSRLRLFDPAGAGLAQVQMVLIFSEDSPNKILDSHGIVYA